VSKEHDISAKEHCIFVKEPYISAHPLYIVCASPQVLPVILMDMSKKPDISAKEPYISAKDP